MQIPNSADQLTMNATMRKFGAPQTVIRQYQYWSVMLRPAQVTLGAMVLVAHEPARTFSELSAGSFTELHEITAQIELALAKAFHNDKLNYLMLMMVDPDVHFHVIPRYAQPRQFDNIEFLDSGWPAMPDLAQTNKTDEVINQHIKDYLLSCWS